MEEEEFTHPLCPNGLVNCSKAYDPERYSAKFHLQLVEALGDRLEALLATNRTRNLVKYEQAIRGERKHEFLGENVYDCNNCGRKWFNVAKYRCGDHCPQCGNPVGPKRGE
jgi:hypothetical protein